MQWRKLAWLLPVALVFCIGGAHGQAISPPKFTEPAHATSIYIDANKNKEILCQADGVPKPTYWWWKGDKPMAESEYVKVNPESGTLSFTGYMSREDGYYMCVATSKTSGSTPTEATSFGPVLWVRQRKEGEFSEIERTFNVQEYSYLRIPCNMTSPPVGGVVSYKWYRGVESDQVKEFDNGRLYIDVAGNFHFMYVKMADGTNINNLAYRCGYSASWISAIYLGDGNNVKVRAEAAAPIPFTLKYSNSGIQVKLFGTVTLDCVFGGYDPNNPNPPPVIWLDNNNQPIGQGTSSGKYKISPDTRQLEINNVKMEDEGNYKCSIAGGLKSNVFLDVISAPFFKNGDDRPKELQVVPEGNNVKINCNAISMPGETEPQPPVWYINGKEFSTSFNQQKYQLSADSKQMTIASVRKPQDTQCIQCKIRNHIGTTWADGCIRVIDSISITMRPPEKQEIERGDIVDLTVRATGDPSEKLTIIYNFKDEPYIYPVLPPFAKRTANQDYINTTELTEEQYQSITGVYSVRIMNQYENRTMQTEVLLVDKPPPAPVKASSGVPAWIFILIGGVILLLLILLCIICVICRKKQEGDYNVDKKETGAGLNPTDELKAKGFDDFSRPQDYDEYDFPDKPRRDIPFEDDALVPDEQDSEDEEAFFNEDGSFIGQYHKKDLARDKAREANESNI